jgi:hypothetical protein
MQDDLRLPMWMSKAADTAERGTRAEYYSIIYLVKFDDVDLLMSNDRHNLVNSQTGQYVRYELCKNKWKLFIGSDESKLCERIRSKESYRKKLFNLIDKIYKDDRERKRIERITNEINPSADLL